VKLTEIATNVDAEEEGAWIEMTRGWTGKVRSWNCKLARQMRQRHLKANRRFYASREVVPLEIVESQALELAAEVLIVDWKGIEDAEGTPIPFSTELAKTILGDPQYRRMLDDVCDAAMENETFRTAAMESLPSTSAGT